MNYPERYLNRHCLHMNRNHLPHPHQRHPRSTTDRRARATGPCSSPRCGRRACRTRRGPSFCSPLRGSSSGGGSGNLPATLHQFLFQWRQRSIHVRRARLRRAPGPFRVGRRPDREAAGGWRDSDRQMKATANGDTTRVVCKVRARVRLSRVRASNSNHAPRHRGWPDFGFQLKFCSLSLFWFFWAVN